MTTHFTLKEVFDFCWSHRGRHGFKGWAIEQAIECIVEAANADQLVIVSDKGSLCGVCIYTKEEENVIYVHHIFATGPGVTTLINEAMRRFPGWRVIGHKRGRTNCFKFNTNKTYGRRSSNDKTNDS